MEGTLATALLLLVFLHQSCGAPAPAPGVPVAAARSAASPKADLQQTEPENSEVADITRTSAGKTDMMMMQMWFYAGSSVVLWFEKFDVKSKGQLAGACIGLAVMAILYEGLKVGRILLAGRLDSAGIASPGHWVQAYLHFVQVTVSYFLMLAVMTYNCWLMLAVCIGAGLGYAIFASCVPTKALLGSASEHCH